MSKSTKEKHLTSKLLSLVLSQGYGTKVSPCLSQRLSSTHSAGKKKSLGYKGAFWEIQRKVWTRGHRKCKDEAVVGYGVTGGRRQCSMATSVTLESSALSQSVIEIIVIVFSQWCPIVAHNCSRNTRYPSLCTKDPN